MDQKRFVDQTKWTCTRAEPFVLRSSWKAPGSGLEMMVTPGSAEKSCVLQSCSPGQSELFWIRHQLPRVRMALWGRRMLG